jgi:CRISPR type III-A-associated protein Csm2
MAEEQEQKKEPSPPREGRGAQGGPPRGDRPGGERPGGDRPGGDRPGGGRSGGGRPGGDRPGGDRPGGGDRGDRGGDRGDRGGDRGDRRGFDRGRPEGPPEIELEKLIGDSLYLDNQAHAIVSRIRDMDSGTKTQLRRLYSAVRRAVRAADSERQHEFVMLRARLAYTIARHGLRSLDQLEKLLLQVTRRNDMRGYERFKDLFEAIVAYNE